MTDGRGTGGDSEWRDQCRRWTGNWNGRFDCQGVPLEGAKRPRPGGRGEGSRGCRVVGGRDDGLEPKGGVGPGGRSIATGLGWKPVGGCDSAEMRRPAIRSTAHAHRSGDRIDSRGLAMGAHDIGWIGAMGLFFGGVRHWMERGDEIDSWGLAMGVHDTGWIRVMGLIYGGVPWGHAAGTGSGRWDWFMGMCHGGARLDQDDGIDWWGCATLAGSGRWEWFMGARHGGMRHWLDQGDGIDS